MAGTAGACFVCVAGGAGAADVGCMHGADAGDAGNVTKKQWLDTRQSLQCGSSATGDSVSCFDTAFMQVPLCVTVCGTIAGVY